MNSIKDNQRKEDTIISIKLSLHHPSSSGLHIIVEGVSDIGFLRSILNKKVNLYESYSGKLGVIEIVDFFDVDCVIGVCDRDYNEINHSKIFYYDHHSLETMLVLSDKAFEKVVCNISYSVDDIDSFKKAILNCSKPISILRKVANMIRPFLKFEGVTPYYYIVNGACDVDLLIDRFMSINAGLDKKLLQKCIDENMSLLSDSELHGHDLMCITTHLLKPKIKYTTLQEMFRISFSNQEFKKTELYKRLYEYICTINLFDSKQEIEFVKS